MTVTEVVPRVSRGPTIRLRPAPPSDPPFDDELPPEIWAPPNQLAFDFRSDAEEGSGDGVAPGTMGAGRASGRGGQLRGRCAGDARGAEDGHIAGAAGEISGRAGGDAQAGAIRGRAGGGHAGGGHAGDDGDAGGTSGSRASGGLAGGMASGSAREASTCGLVSAGGSAASDEPGGVAGDARRAVRRFVQLAVEVLNGHRPAAQLRRLAHPMEASRVVAQAITGAHRVNQLRRAAQVNRPSPVGVRGVRLCEPRTGAVEAAVLLETGERTWAMALRLELHHEAWTATVLRLI